MAPFKKAPAHSCSVDKGTYMEESFKGLKSGNTNLTLFGEDLERLKPHLYRWLLLGGEKAENRRLGLAMMSVSAVFREIALVVSSSFIKEVICAFLSQHITHKKWLVHSLASQKAAWSCREGSEAGLMPSNPTSSPVVDREERLTSQSRAPIR